MTRGTVRVTDRVWEHDVTTHPTDRIRNVALVGASGAGTTSLAEALLARAGAIARAGRVDDGTSVLDTDPESVKRRMSLSLALAPFDWTATDGTVRRVNLIDTPGYLDFEGAVDAALSVADLVVVVVSAVDGVEPRTETLWRAAHRLGLPRMVFVNKEDKERADFHGVLEQLRAAFGTGFAPLELPLGEAGTLHGVADVLSEAALAYEPGGTHHTELMPHDVADEEHRLHDALVEEIVAGDDDQLERYLAGEVPTVADLERVLAHEVLAGTEFPVLLGSALTGVGVDRLADFICEIGPSPADRPVRVLVDGREESIDADPAGTTVVQVFTTVADPFLGQLSWCKVLRGTLRQDDRLVNGSTGTEERLHGLFALGGKEQAPLDLVAAGDMVAVAKLSNTRTGDVLAPKGAVYTAPDPERHPPQYAVAITPRTRADDDRMGGALTRLLAEDPTLTVERVEETQQTVLRGLGETHVAVALERMARKFGVEVDTSDVRIAYRETVTGTAAAEGKVKKQSGGHGQFAVVNLRVSPLGRGEGFRFTDAVVGGVIPRNHLPAVQAGVEDAMHRGGVHGFTVVDVHVECFDGKYHPVDSSDMAFRTAAAQGFRDAIAAAGPVVLEPVSLLEVVVPSAFQGDVMGDISTRRGRVQGSTTNEQGEQEIRALVPAAELRRYATELRSMTGGRGRFTAQHHHYDVLPPNLLDRMRASATEQQ